MKKNELSVAIDEAIADLAKVPVPGQADIAIEICERVKNSLALQQEDSDISLKLAVKAFVIVGSAIYFENR